MARNANMEVLNELRSRILRRDYLRGEFLPSERALAEDLNVGRCVIRGALSSLRKEGLLYRVDGKGLCVARHDNETFSRILVVTPPVSAHPYEELFLISYISNELDRRSAEPRVIFFNDKMNMEKLSLICREGGYQGVLMIETVNNEADFKKFRELVNLPYVLVNQEDFFAGASCYVNFRLVGRLAGQQLLQASFRHIGCITGSLDRMIFKEMLAGLRGALAEEEVYLQSSDILQIEPSLTMESYDMLRDYLKRSDRPEAVFCMRDRRADFLYRAAGELGIRIPEDLSVISFDNITWPDGGAMGLTTITQPLEEMAAVAVEMLRNYCISGQEPEAVMVSGKLIKRSSIAGTA